MILGILLAAGASHRMGSDKLGLPWRGSTVLLSSLARWTAVPGLDEILLVRRGDSLGEQVLIRPGDSSGAQECRVRILENVGANEGMGSSLRLAAQSLPTECEAVVVGLADMPEITSDTISALVEAWRPFGSAGIVAPRLGGQRGHPVVLGADHFSALRLLTGDSGARTILKDQADDLHLVDVDDPGILFDLDTPADLEQMP
jgi:molybdenum cofactor cytidylyltransferase